MKAQMQTAPISVLNPVKQQADESSNQGDFGEFLAREHGKQAQSESASTSKAKPEKGEAEKPLDSAEIKSSNKGASAGESTEKSAQNTDKKSKDSTDGDSSIKGNVAAVTQGGKLFAMEGSEETTDSATLADDVSELGADEGSEEGLKPETLASTETDADSKASSDALAATPDTKRQINATSDASEPATEASDDGDGLLSAQTSATSNSAMTSSDGGEDGQSAVTSALGKGAQVGLSEPKSPKTDKPSPFAKLDTSNVGEMATSEAEADEVAEATESDVTVDEVVLNDTKASKESKTPFAAMLTANSNEVKAQGKAEAAPADDGTEVVAETKGASASSVSALTDAEAVKTTGANAQLLAQLQGVKSVQEKLNGSTAAPVSATEAGSDAVSEALPGRSALPKSSGELGTLLTSGDALTRDQAQILAAHENSALEAQEGSEVDNHLRQHNIRTAEPRSVQHNTADVQAQLRQPVAAERMAPELRERMMMMINSRTNQAEIRLDPPELGALQVKIQMNGDQAQLQLQVAQTQTREMVEQALPRLREMLEQQGITLTDTQISQGGGNQGGQEQGGQFAGGDGMVEVDDETLHNVQQLSGRNVDGGIDYYA
ncbi:flagellar hook-length control protein FliK [Ferrimonas aestuarii]|uniref:Flagellar hook-length control protein-like C-terminal domain-containing protein n=1 Tax=Ferrimonas aestuarii TaxID=2569539 RepID=A0A4U1BS72_9GAMM|nr:flagellar hook-length control protein FliK [Ferrimonas aestuarii]TKB58236.1 hypothetical protein FCL42_00285 [Ferrimonas aestuarii]